METLKNVNNGYSIWTQIRDKKTNKNEYGREHTTQNRIYGTILLLKMLNVQNELKLKMQDARSELNKISKSRWFSFLLLKLIKLKDRPIGSERNKITKTIE